jgi:hypothetical protein
MQSDSRTGTFGRIGRRYPRPLGPAADGAGRPAGARARRRKLVAAALGLLAVVGLVGWLVRVALTRFVPL